MLTNTLRKRKKNSSSDAASWAMMLEQGLALDELLGMKVSLERGVQTESGGKQSLPTAGAAERDAAPRHRRNYPMVKAYPQL